MYVCMYICMYKDWTTKTSPLTATFEDLLLSHICMGIHMGSNPTQSMDVCVFFSVYVVLCIGRGLSTG
jgi:hypothetical protein